MQNYPSCNELDIEGSSSGPIGILMTCVCLSVSICVTFYTFRLFKFKDCLCVDLTFKGPIMTAADKFCAILILERNKE